MKRKTLLLMLLLALGAPWAAWAQSTVKMGPDGATHVFPFNNFYHYSWNQMIYTAEELGGSQTISSISFLIGGVPSSTFTATGVKIYLGHTTLCGTTGTSDLTSTSWVPSSSLTQVYSTSSYTPTSYTTYTDFNQNWWITINFSTSFSYNGTDNLAVVVTSQNSSYSSGLTFKYINDAHSMCLYRRSDSSSDYYGTHPGTNSGTTATTRPVIRLNGAEKIINIKKTSISANSSVYFVDEGGDGGDCSNSDATYNYYSRSSQYRHVFTAPAGSTLNASFTTLCTESCCDNLNIYNGNSTSSSTLATGLTSTPSGTYSSTGNNMTFMFRTDGSVNRAGWKALISAVSPPTLTYSASPSAGGTVTVTQNGSTVSSGAVVTPGSTLDITATPASGYVFNGWTSSGTSASVTTPQSRTTTLTMGSTNTTLTASFISGYGIDQSGNITACSGTVYDPGGNGYYDNNQDYTRTIYPGTSGNKVRLTFSVFETENSWDYLYIYDGTSTSATSLGSFSGTTSPGTVTATNSDGALTLRWYSDGSNCGYAGFAATISCVSQINVTAGTGGSASGGGSFTSGQSCTVTATPNSGYCFLNWTNNGTVMSTSPTYTFNVSQSLNLVANFINLSANSISVSGNSVTCGNSATLTASGLDNSVTYKWYSDAACTQLVGTGATLTTPELYENTTYYVVAEGGNSFVPDGTPTTYSSYGNYTYSVPSGTPALLLEVWGAQGGGSQSSGNSNSGVGGKGGYSVGTLWAPSGTLYVYVGGVGGSSTSGTASGGYNGGGTTYATSETEPANGGGGATDIRLNGTSLNHRIIVAGGGGGGGEDSSDLGGYGGGTSGGNGNSYSYPGTQNSCSGGAAFGYGASSNYDGGGGGGGWYGGGTNGGSQTSPTSNSTSDCGGGSGGSGYVWTSATASYAPSGYSVSSSYYLTDAQTIGGNATMPNPAGGTMTGREGAGYARITPYVLGHCESEAKAVTVTVTSPSASDITVGGNSTACGNSASLSASGLSGVVYNWYSDAACTNLVGTGSTWTTPALYNNTTYYVKAVKEGESEEEHTFTYQGSVQTCPIPAGVNSAKLEVWGAQGGDATYGGKGGYSVGTLNNLNGISDLYVYVGQQPTSTTGGWNGGGGYSSYGSSGGGATDISLHNYTYNTTDHYNDRIIVAGGGGGKGYSSTYGGYGGGLNGGAGGAGSATSGGAGASQTSGGNSGTGGSGSGYAGGYGAASTNNSHNGGGGGGGWYGGGSGVGSGTDAGGGGGSGYVWTSATASSAPSGYSVSSSYYLTNAQTIAGNTSFYAPDGSSETGHSGHGYARITLYYPPRVCESEAKAVTVTVTQPAAPTNVTATADLTTATVTWDDNGESNWQYTINNGTDWNNASTSTVNLNGLTPGTTYTFTVKALGNGTCESSTASTTFTTLNSHDIFVIANPTEGGSVTGQGTYDHGQQVTITATANPGYTFQNWTKNGTEVSSSPNYEFTANEDATYMANFNHVSYNITYSPTQSSSTNGCYITGSTSSAYYGADVTVTLHIAPGYQLQYISCTVPMTGSGTEDGDQYTFRMPEGNVSVTATFEKIDYTITYSPAQSSPSNGCYVAGNDTAQVGDNVALTVNEGTGYHLTGLTATYEDHGVTTQLTITNNSFTMPAGNVTVTATFAKNEYTITVTPVPSTNEGTVNIYINNVAQGNSVTVEHGTSVTVTATPAQATYVFVNWTRGNAADAEVMSTDATYTFNAIESIDLVAHFDFQPPVVVTDNQVTNITDSHADVSGSVTSQGQVYGYGFAWGTQSNPVYGITGSYSEVGSGTGAFNATIPANGGLSSNTLYYLRAYARYPQGTAYGSDVTFTTQATATQPTVNSYLTTSANLTGGYTTDGNESITGCGFVYGTTNNPTLNDGTQVEVQTVASPFTADLTGLTGNTTYYVRAYVTNAGGTNYGPVATFTTLPYYPVTALVSPAEAGSVTFSPAGIQASESQTAQVGDGTELQAFFPFFSTRKYSFNEMIYPHSDAMVQGNITKISFHYRQSNDNLNHSLEIYLKAVNQDVFTSGEIIPVSSSDRYFTGTVTTVNNVDQWVEITLNTPFEYDGTSNILVAVNNKTGISSTRNWYSTETNALTGLCYRSNNSEIDPANLSGGEFLSDASCTKRPNAIFTIEASNSDTHYYAYGEDVELTAVPANSDYAFSHWTVDGSTTSTDNPYTIEDITAAHTLTANFVLSYKRFVTDGSWTTASNWDPVGVPTISEDVSIEAAATIYDGEIGYANVIRPITHANGSITIKDGGQLVHNNAASSKVTVTAENTIAGYTSADANTNKGYELISFPVDNLTAGNSAIQGLVTTDPYDFYRFDASEDPLEWIPMAGTDNISLLQGFIYASQEGTTISVTGPVMSSATPVVSSEVDYVIDNAPRFNGWALLGNPFVCNAYVSANNNGEVNFYKLNHTADYDEFVPFTNSDAVTPMGGVMFQVDADNAISYSRTQSSGAKTGILNVDVNKATMRGTTTLDRARVRFGEGRNLEKFQFDTRHTKIYIPEGDQDFSVYYADGAGTIPVNFKAQDNGRYTLDFSTEEVGFNYLHLIDNMTGNDVDLLQTPYYAFDAKSTDFASRFLLVFATGNDNGETFAFFNNGVWIINNDGDATLQVVDALGRVLSSESISGSTSKAINVAPGVYMLRLINGDKVKVQKIVVKR